MRLPIAPIIPSPSEAERLRSDNAALRQRAEAAERELERERQSEHQTMQERDHYHGMADKLAQGIADHFRVELCEHSSAERPWEMALDILSGEYVTDEDMKRERDEARRELKAWKSWVQIHCGSGTLKAGEIRVAELLAEGGKP